MIDHENNMLKKGEIGCSLSHMKIYKRMMDENIPIALVLEDDAVLLDELVPAMADIEQYDDANKPNVYILTAIERYYPMIKKKMGSTTLYKVHRTCYTHGYIINNAAARKLYEHFYPVWMVADSWEVFKLIAGIKIYGTIPYVIDNNDFNKAQSVIFHESGDFLTRKKYEKQLLAKKPGYLLKKALHRLSRAFARKSWVHDRSQYKR